MTLVLLVDDDPWQLEHFERQLQQDGLQVIKAANALAAVNLIDSHQPDVVVLDMMMPGPNGLALLHELQSHTDLVHVPIIVCSSAPIDKVDLTPYGVVAVLDKATISQTDLVAAVKRISS